jgi:hypothetical protein
MMRIIERRAWVEEVGRKVLLLRLPNMDITLAFWKLLPRICFYLHDGVPASYRWKPDEHDIIVRRTGKPEPFSPLAPIPVEAVKSAEPLSQWVN